MARPGVFGHPSDMPDEEVGPGLFERPERVLEALKITPSPASMRILMAALAGILLLMARGGFIWAWVGAMFFMLSVQGASGAVGAAAGAITGAIAYFRVLGPLDASAFFWVMMVFHAAGGAIAGACAAEISTRLPRTAFAFLAALLPAGLEQLGAFAAAGHLGSTALTQYAHPAIVRMGRLGGMAGVTYIIFLFGGAASSAVRYLREGELVVACAAPPAALVVVGLLYGLATGGATETQIHVAALSPNGLAAKQQELYNKKDYDGEGWAKFAERLADDLRSLSQRRVGTRAINRVESDRGVDVLVAPEASIALDDATIETFQKRMRSTLNTTGCVQVVGFYDKESMQSRVGVTAEDPEELQEYSRRRFVPRVDDEFFPGEVVVRGDRPAKAVKTRAGVFGAVLSYDANSFAAFKSIARSGGQIVCVSALDDQLVPQTSHRLLVYNAALSAMGVVRSARNGTMMVISPDGEIIDTKKTQAKANNVLFAWVPLGKGKTAFLAIGNLFAWLALLSGLAVGLYASTLEEPPDARKPYRSLPPTTGPISFKTRDGVEKL